MLSAKCIRLPVKCLVEEANIGSKFVRIITPINPSTYCIMNERKTWKKALTVLLMLQILVAFSLGTLALVNFPMLLEQFGINFQPDMGILRLIMVYNLFLSASICLWSVMWIRSGNIAGIQAGTTVGFLMFIVSTTVFILFQRMDILLFDGVRALLMVVFGVLAYREQQKHQITVS